MSERCSLSTQEKFRVYQFITKLKESSPSKFPMDQKSLIALIASGVGVVVNHRVLKTILIDAGLNESEILNVNSTGTPVANLHNRVSMLLSRVDALEARLEKIEKPAPRPLFKDNQ